MTFVDVNNVMLFKYERLAFLSTEDKLCCCRCSSKCS